MKEQNVVAGIITFIVFIVGITSITFAVAYGVSKVIVKVFGL